MSILSNYVHPTNASKDTPILSNELLEVVSSHGDVLDAAIEVAFPCVMGTVIGALIGLFVGAAGGGASILMETIFALFRHRLLLGGLSEHFGVFGLEFKVS